MFDDIPTDFGKDDFVIDFSDVKGPEPVPEGLYVCEIVAAKAARSKAGNPKISCRYKILEGEYEGRMIFDDLTFTENSLFRVKQLLEAIGYDAKFKGAVQPEKLIGARFKAMVVIRASTAIDQATGDAYPAQNNVRKYSSLGDSLDSLLG